MEITQEQAKIIHEWFSKLLAVDPSKIRGSDFTLAYIIKDAAQQSVQRTANTEANIGDPRNIERNLSGKRGATRRR